MAPSKPSSPTTANPAYSITSEKQEPYLKAHLISLMEDFKDINNSLKEIQENMGQQVEALKEETQKSLKNYRKTQTSEGTEQNHPGSKNGSRNNEEITKGDSVSQTSNFTTEQ